MGTPFTPKSTRDLATPVGLLVQIPLGSNAMRWLQLRFGGEDGNSITESAEGRPTTKKQKSFRVNKDNAMKLKEKY